MRQLSLDSVPVDNAKRCQPAFKQPGAQHIKIVEDHATVDARHVALGASVKNLLRQRIGERAPCETAIPTAGGEDGGGQGEAGLDHGLSAEWVSDIDVLVRPRRRVP
jgi:hypothetical protein